MNILMALSQLEVTGAEVYGVTLANELISRGNRVTIVSDTLTKETKAEYRKIEFNKRNLFNRFYQVKELVKIIRELDIEVVHAHSRASSWAANIACKIMDIPLVCTVHGRQPVHLSRKIIKGFGNYILPVCENIKNHIIGDFSIKDNKCRVVRNPIDSSEYIFTSHSPQENPVISIIGRLSGPKGDVAYNLLNELVKNEKYKIQVVGGKEIPPKFEMFKNKVEFLGYINNVSEIIENSSVVIGAGRVAVEGMLSGRAVIAIGEAELSGVMRLDNLSKGLESNFGDIGKKNTQQYDYSKILEMTEDALSLYQDENELKNIRENIAKEFSKESIVQEIEKLYQRMYVEKRQYEIPVLMYHRVIDGKDEEKGVHGVYVTKKHFENHLRILIQKGYETVTFKDLAGEKYKNRFDGKHKRIILTFDDGYEDNYKNAFPLLQKYKSKAVIYLMGDRTYNKWDTDNSENPEKKFNLMSDEMIKEMSESHLIEFGVHTLTHPRLSKIDIEEAKREILESKKIIEAKIGEKTTSFAYPYGDYNKEIKELAKEAGFEFAVVTDNGPICFSDDLFEIRRIALFCTNSLFNFRRKISGKYNFIRVKRENKHKNKI